SFFGGDWCWGPRYAIPVMPLWALALPFAVEFHLCPRRLAAALALAGLLIQFLGISLEAQRFFYERNLPGPFLTFDPWFYFKDSQLVARPLEILDTLNHGLPKEALRFTSGHPQATYSLLSTRHCS